MCVSVPAAATDRRRGIAVVGVDFSAPHRWTMTSNIYGPLWGNKAKQNVTKEIRDKLWKYVKHMKQWLKQTVHTVPLFAGWLLVSCWRQCLWINVNTEILFFPLRLVTVMWKLHYQLAQIKKLWYLNLKKLECYVKQQTGAYLIVWNHNHKVFTFLWSDISEQIFRSLTNTLTS